MSSTPGDIILRLPKPLGPIDFHFLLLMLSSIRHTALSCSFLQFFILNDCCPSDIENLPQTLVDKGLQFLVQHFCRSPCYRAVLKLKYLVLYNQVSLYDTTDEARVSNK